MRITADHNLRPSDLVPTLVALAYAEDVVDPLEKALAGASASREPIPETWMEQLVERFCDQGRRLDGWVFAHVDRLVRADLYEPDDRIAKAIKPSMLPVWKPGNQRPARLMLSQAQVDELSALVRAHYRVAIKAGGATEWAIDAATERRWKALGLVAPDVDLGAMIGDSFVAGRMAQILDDGASLADMRRMARELPLSREASLTMQAVQERVRFDLSGGLGYRAETEVGRLALGQNSERVQDIIAAYRSGQLTGTPTNRERFTAEEMDAISEDRAIAGWRGLGRELRNRMAGEDRARDWERVAVSSLRQSANIGAISAMAEEKIAELWYDVHPSACDRCKRLYLEDDGTPRIFLVDDVLEEVTTNGGANYGRTSQEWQPTALAHPWCQCRPKRRIANVTPKGRIEAEKRPKVS